MKDDTENDPETGPGTTSDPNQANRTGLPEVEEVRPEVDEDDADPEDPGSGPGSTGDPNQANRT